MAKNAVITGWGCYVPSRVMTNADLERIVDTSDEWITSRTGIKDRRVAADGETTSSMSVRAGVRYPPILLTTAEGDSRVDPMHARKMAALLQAQSEDPNSVVLLRVDRDAGHGIGKPLDKQVDELADQYAFLAWRTGLPVGETGMLGRQ